MVPSISGGLLAATLLLGQTTDVQIIQQPGGGKTYYYSSSSSSSSYSSTTQTAQPEQPQRPFFSWFSREDRPVRARFQSWFGRKEQQEPPLGTPPTFQPSGKVINEGTPISNPGNPAILPSTPTPLDFPKKMPSPVPASQSSSPRPLPAAPPVSAPVKPVQQTSLQAPADNVKSPIRPQLADKIGRDDHFEWVTGQLEMEKGQFVLYYATPETVDKYHGRIVLQPQKVDMGQFHRGDLISVRGELIQRQTPQGATATYRATDATLLERAKS